MLRGSNGTPPFRSGPSVTVNGEYGDVVAGDFNGDGWDDVAFWPFPVRRGRLIVGSASGFVDQRPHGRGPALVTRRDRPQRRRPRRPGAVRPRRRSRQRLPRPAPTRPWYRVHGVNITGPYTAMVGGDFNGDGRGDVVLWGNGTLPDRVWYGNT